MQTRKYLSWRWRVGGLEFVDFNAFNEIDDFFKSASLREPLGRDLRSLGKRRNVLEGWGSEFVDFDAFDEVQEICNASEHEGRRVFPPL